MPAHLELSEASNDLDGKVALITGASAGIGLETAIELRKRGCKVVITSHCSTRGHDAAQKIRTRVPGTLPSDVDFLRLECLGPGEVVQEYKIFAAAFKSRHSRLDILIFNGGQGGFSDDERADDQIDRCFLERLISQHILTHLFWDLLAKSGVLDSPSRVITTTAFAYNDSKHTANDWLQAVMEKQGLRLDFPTFCVSLVGWSHVLNKECKNLSIPITFLLTHPGFVSSTEKGRNCAGACLVDVMPRWLGGHTAMFGWKPNVAACVSPLSKLSPPRDAIGFIAPTRTTRGEPSLIDLHGKDAEDWGIFAGTLEMPDIGKTVLRELSRGKPFETTRIGEIVIESIGKEHRERKRDGGPRIGLGPVLDVISLVVFVSAVFITALAQEISSRAYIFFR